MTSIYNTAARLASLPEHVVQHFELTETESDVCLGLVQGKSLDDLADETPKSRAELRTMLSSLLDKTGTDTEAKLVTVILAKYESR